MEWKISRAHGKCMVCQTVLEENQFYYSALTDAGVEFVRKDFCLACWGKRTEEVFSFWKSRVPPREKEAQTFVDDEALMEFFHRLEPEQEASKVHFRYLLGLMLMRKKRLKFEDLEREEGREYLILRQPGEEVRYRVLDPKLSQDKLDQLKEELNQILYQEV
ncbi:MAG: hypothetical protein HYU36_09420 [Planctomycetes bacterium]|nr:hypothetical protein [Planctomycetota bacterium]